MTLLDGTPSSRVRQTTRESRVPWSQYQDRWTFFGFFLVGALSILTLKSLVDSPFIATGVPCGLMLIYARMQWDSGTKQPVSDAAGDNLYYLGFLYTLTSLAHSLYSFSPDEAHTEIIVTNFGIAISTTILGMALRVLLGRPNVQDPSVLGDAARVDLAETARKLRREMSYTVETFGEALEKDLNSIRQRLTKDAANTLDINSETIKYMQSLGQTITRLDAAIDKVASGLITRAQELDQSTVAWTTMQDSIRQLDSSVKEQIEAIEQRSRALAADAEEISEALVAKAQEVRSVDFQNALLNAVEPASNELRAAALEIKNLLSTLRQSDAMLVRVLTNIERATTGFQETLSGQHELAKSILDTLRDSRDSASSLRAVSEQLVSSIDGAQNMTDRITSLRDGLAESAERIHDVNEDFKQTSTRLRSWILETKPVPVGRNGFRWLRWPSAGG